MQLRKTHTQFVEQSSRIHGGKYKYPETYAGDAVKISIECPIHGMFHQVPSSHLQGSGCPRCAIDLRAKILSSSHDEFVNKANIVHDGKYKYVGVYKGAHVKIEIECPIHSIFLQRAGKHLVGDGCPKCAGTMRKTKEQFVSEAIEVHDGKYTYPGDYVNARSNIEIKCPKHGTFFQVADVHLNGAGCPKCSLHIRTTGEFIVEANEVHGGYYKYPDEYTVSQALITIECPKHGPFLQRPHDHLRGGGCPSCSINTVSKPETAWLDSLGMPQEYRQVSLKIGDKLIKPDAYDPNTNTIYEFYGDYWHGNPAVFDPNKIHHLRKIPLGELYRATMEREDMIRKAGYNFVSIWELDWNNNE